MSLTSRRDMDCRNALVRGLADYLRGLSGAGAGGREVRLQTVEELWGAADGPPATFPAAAVQGDGEGRYVDRLPGGGTGDRYKLGSGKHLQVMAEFETTLNVQVWATDKLERAALGLMLEDGLCPLDWMYGFRLELPHYHGLRGAYALEGTYLEDSQELAAQGICRLVARVSARLPFVRLVGLALGDPRAVVEVDKE